MSAAGGHHDAAPPSARTLDYEGRIADLQQKIRELDEGRAMLASRLRDLETQKGAIEEIHHSWVTLFDAIHDPIFLHDAQGRIVRANHAYAEQAGLDILDTIGKFYWEVFPRRDGPLPGCVFAIDKNTETEEIIEINSGKAIFHSRSFPVHGVRGEHLYSVHVLQDVTARRKAESELRESEQRYRMLFNSMLDGFALHEIILDEQGKPCDYRFLEINPAFEPHTGLRREDVIGKTVREILPGIEAHWIERYGKVALTGEAVRFESHSRELDKYFDVTAFRPQEGQFATIFSDITPRRRAAEALRRANRALRTLSTINQIIIQATSEAELLNAVCQTAVGIGGYRFAWVGFAEQDEQKTVRPVAQAGYEEGYLQTLNLTWADEERGRGPTGTAIRTGKPCITRNIHIDPAFAPWREEATRQGYASCISLPIANSEDLLGALSIYSEEQEAFDEDEVKLLTELADDLSYGITSLRTRAERDQITYEHQHHLETLKKSLKDSIQAIAATLEMRDPYTAGHEKRVAQLAVATAHEMGLPETQIEGIHIGGLIHDIGKIQVPAEILSYPGRLSKAQFELIKAHPQAGYDIIKGIEFPWPVAQMILQHHERLDGSGYPQGLKGDEISLEARILAVADVVEAMASHRPYRPGLGIDKALEEISRNSGVHYDAAAVDACLRLFREKGFAFEQ